MNTKEKTKANKVKAALKSAEVRRNKRVKKDLEKAKVQEAVNQQIFNIAHKLVNVQQIVAQGTHKMVRMFLKDGIPATETISDMDRMQDLLDNGEYGIDYVIVVGKEPDAKAADMMLNRALGKPVESLEIGNLKDEPFIIIDR